MVIFSFSVLLVKWWEIRLAEVCTDPVVICGKRSAIPPIVVSIFLKTCVKDHGDSFRRLLARKKDWLSIYWGALVSGFVNVLVYFNKQANNVETARYIFSTNLKTDSRSRD